MATTKKGGRKTAETPAKNAKYSQTKKTSSQHR